MNRLAVYTDTGDLDPTEGILALRNAGFEIKQLETHQEEVIVSEARQAVALLVGYAKITQSIIDQLPNLRVISMLGTGADNIDTNAVLNRKIPVLTLGALPAEEVATHTMSIMLSILRGVPQFSASAQSLRWFETPHPFVPPRLSELNCGILGFGNIGQVIARYCLPFFASVSFYDSFIKKSSNSKYLVKSFDDLLSSSDVLIISIPASSENKYLFNSKTFAKMKYGAFLVNTSRGSIVNSGALADAVRSGQLTGAALDVVDGEPAQKNNPLLNNLNILITPHIAYLSNFTLKAYIKVQAQNVIEFFQREEMLK